MIPGELDRSELECVFEGEQLPIASRADASISKLVWVAKGSHKSRRDFRKIFIGSTVDDRNSILGLAEQMNLKPLLDEVVAECDEFD